MNRGTHPGSCGTCNNQSKRFDTLEPWLSFLIFETHNDNNGIYKNKVKPIRTDRQETRSDEHSDLQHERVQQEFSRAKDYSSEYQEGKTPIAHFFNTRLKRVSELLSDFKSGKVLDVGCGPGIIGNTFRGRPIEYYGVDISEDMLRVCNETFGSDPHFRFSIGRIEELKFSDSYFDVVLCLGAFEYVLEGHVAMREIIRVLKPKGIVIITMLNGKSLYRIWQRYIYGKLINGINKLMRLIIRTKNDQETQRLIRPKTRLYNEKAFRHLLTTEGLEIEDIVYYDFRLLLSPLDTRFPGVSVFLSGKLEFLYRSKFKFLGTGFIFKCRKIKYHNHYTNSA